MITQTQHICGGNPKIFLPEKMLQSFYGQIVSGHNDKTMTRRSLPVTDGPSNALCQLKCCQLLHNCMNKISSGYEIANMNFYAVRPDSKLPEFAEITQNNAITPFKVIQGHRFWYQSKAHIRFPTND